jgi:hypothetical protein
MRHAAMHDRCLGRLRGPFVAFEVWLVHGRLVRDRIDVDFTMGGNPARYPRYVPSGELWIDAVLSPRDVAATVVHEVVETIAMQRGGLRYGRAHDLANVEERDVREELEATHVPSRAAAFAWARRYLTRRGILAE